MLCKPVNRAEVDKVWSTEIFLGVVGGLRQGFVIVFSSEWVGLICIVIPMEPSVIMCFSQFINF